MNSGSDHKIYNYELTPPPGVWEKIAAELDQSELSSTFPKKLRRFKITPPVEAWSKIAAMLRGSSLEFDYSSRLENAELVPPAAIWNKIQVSLSEDKAPVRRIFPVWARYAVAASLIGLIAFGATQWLNKNKSSDKTDLASKQINPSPLDKVPVSTSPSDLTNITSNNTKPTVTTPDEDERRNDLALEQSKKTFAKLDGSISSKIKQASAFSFASDSYEPTVATRGPEFESSDMECINLANRYIILMTPEGNIIRMSKKLTDLVCCVSGEIEEKDCQDQMRKWRDKIACTPSGHSAGNFLELLNLVNSLQEN